jgi:GDP-4-dehydro-6-deoxy-D-mannose reductase
MTPKRVLVTGATGLLGRALLERLADGPFETIGLARSAPHGISADLREHEGAHAAAAVRPDAVVHLAGSAGGDETALERSNVTATANLIEVLSDARPYVVVAGSAAEYGEPPDGIIRDDSPTAPLTPYGRAKVRQTELAQRECERHGMPLTIARPFNVVARDLPQTTALGNFRHQLLAQSGSPRTLRCGRLDVVRDYVSATFVADALARLLELEEPPAVLNVCSGVGIELRAIVDVAAELLGTELELEQDPALAAIPAAERVVGDPSRLRSLGLEYRPTARQLAGVLLQ